LSIFAVTVPLIPHLAISGIVLHGKMIPNPYSSVFTVPKSWFCHFYAFGILATIGLRQIHLTRRFLEQVLLFPYDQKSRMHITAYVFGFTFYATAALSLPAVPDYPLLWVLGNVLQFLAHRDLHNHRCADPSKSRPPHTWLFRYMNCPHYFAEMLIYGGLLSLDSIPSIACTVFVIVSLTVNWRNHSIWYAKQPTRKSARQLN
jgi:hypothetical protein